MNLFTRNLIFVFAAFYSIEIFGNELTLSIDEIKSRNEYNRSLGQGRESSPHNETDLLSSIPEEVLEKIQNEKNQMTSKGFVAVENSETDWFYRLPETLETFVSSLDELNQKLAFNITDTSHLEKRGYNLVGVHTSGSNSENGWTGLTRIFLSDKDGHLIFNEDHTERLMNDVQDDSFSYEMKQKYAQSPSIRVSDLMNTRARGQNAKLTSFESPNGLAFTDLGWSEDLIEYTITIAGNSGKSMRNIPAHQHSQMHIISLANKIVPAAQ